MTEETEQPDLSGNSEEKFEPGWKKLGRVAHERNIAREEALAGLEGLDRLKASLNFDTHYEKSSNHDVNLKYAKLFLGNHFYDKSEEEAFRFIDSHLKEHYDFNEAEISNVKAYTVSRLNAYRKDVTERAKSREEIMISKLPSDIERELSKLVLQYNQSYAEVEKLFYKTACDSKFDSCKDVNEKFAQALDTFKTTFSHKYKKQELVTFDGDVGAQAIYDMIDHVLIKKQKLSSDDTVWEIHINDKELGIDNRKISLTAKQMQSFAGFKTVFFNTFDIPAPKVSGKNWDKIILKLSTNKAEKMEAPEDSDLMDEAKSMLEALFKLQITSTEVEHAAAGKKIFEQNGVYYITAARVKEIWESQKCKFSRGKIGIALVEMGVKYVKSEDSAENKWIGTIAPRCWWFHKDAFEIIRKEGFKEGK